MPKIIPLPGASSEKRAKENLKAVSLNEADMEVLDEAAKRLPIVGSRWPAFLQAFEDK